MSPAKSSSPTREKIIAISGDYFMKNGHRGITMDELAALVGVSKKTIYVYFPTKLAILEAVMDRKFGMIFSILDDVRMQHEQNSVECFAAVITRWQELLSTVQSVFWRDIQADATAFFEGTAARRRKIVHEIFGRIIADGIRKGDFRDDINPTLVAEIMLASIEGLIRSGKAQEFGLSPRELFLTLVRLIISGTLTDAGQEKWRKLKPVAATINT